MGEATVTAASVARMDRSKDGGWRLRLIRPTSNPGDACYSRGRPIQLTAGIDGSIGAHSASVMSLACRAQSSSSCAREISVQDIRSSVS